MGGPLSNQDTTRFSALSIYEFAAHRHRGGSRNAMCELSRGCETSSAAPSDGRMVRFGIGNAWKWAVPQLVGFVMLLCWVDPTSRPIIALFLFVFLAILSIRFFPYRWTPRQTLPTSN